MTELLLVALGLSAVFGLTAPRLARRLPPAIAVWLLSGGAVLAATASSVSLALLAFLSLAPTPDVAARAHWSDQVLRHHDHAPLLIGVVSALLIVTLTVRLSRVAGRRAAALRDAYRLAAVLPGTELCVLDSACAEALALPGRPGRVLATTGLLRVLGADERRAVLEHERAHLKRRHHIHQSAAALAGALNPMLAGIRSALALACERDADEVAARVCPRRTVAAALDRIAALPRGGGEQPAVVLAAATRNVSARVGALRAAPLRLEPWRIGAPGVVLAAAALAVAVAMHDTEHLFELAKHAYDAGTR